MPRPGSRALTLALALNVAPARAVQGPVALMRSLPSEGDCVPSAPDFVELRFDGDVRLTMLVITDGRGRRVETDFAIALQTAATHQFRLGPTGAGAHAVAWQARTADGWRLKGEFRFTVG